MGIYISLIGHLISLPSSSLCLSLARFNTSSALVISVSKLVSCFLSPLTFFFMNYVVLLFDGWFFRFISFSFVFLIDDHVLPFYSCLIIKITTLVFLAVIIWFYTSWRHGRSLFCSPSMIHWLKYIRGIMQSAQWLQWFSAMLFLFFFFLLQSRYSLYMVDGYTSALSCAWCV